jgi:hypothetical protein
LKEIPHCVLFLVNHIYYRYTESTGWRCDLIHPEYLKANASCLASVSLGKVGGGQFSAKNIERISNSGAGRDDKLLGGTQEILPVG